MSTATNSKGAKKPKTQNPKRLNQSFRVQILNLWKWHHKYWGGSWPKIEIPTVQRSRFQFKDRNKFLKLRVQGLKMQSSKAKGWELEVQDPKSKVREMRVEDLKVSNRVSKVESSNACKNPNWRGWELRVEGSKDPNRWSENWGLRILGSLMKSPRIENYNVRNWGLQFQSPNLRIQELKVHDIWLSWCFISDSQAPATVVGKQFALLFIMVFSLFILTHTTVST